MKMAKREHGLRLTKEGVVRLGGGGPITVSSLDLVVQIVAAGSARTRMPGLIRESAEHGRAFLIGNAKNPGAPSALLINPDVLDEKLKEAMRPTRTGAELLANLPFKRRGSPQLTVEAEDDVAPALTVRTRSGMVSVSSDGEVSEEGA